MTYKMKFDSWKSLVGAHGLSVVHMHVCMCVTRMMIRDALNKQTAVQFREYAEQQFPGDAAQVKLLVQQRTCLTAIIQCDLSY